MTLIKKKKLDLSTLADIENANARTITDSVDINDIMTAMVELGDLIAEQDDALVELAELIEE
jgi:hypothetical protein